jgi:hypothetical protein
LNQDLFRETVSRVCGFSVEAKGPEINAGPDSLKKPSMTKSASSKLLNQKSMCLKKEAGFCVPHLSCLDTCGRTDNYVIFFDTLINSIAENLESFMSDERLGRVNPELMDDFDD